MHMRPVELGQQQVEKVHQQKIPEQLESGSRPKQDFRGRSKRAVVPPSILEPKSKPESLYETIGRISGVFALLLLLFVCFHRSFASRYRKRPPFKLHKSISIWSLANSLDMYSWAKERFKRAEAAQGGESDTKAARGARTARRGKEPDSTKPGPGGAGSAASPSVSGLQRRGTTKAAGRGGGQDPPNPAGWHPASAADASSASDRARQGGSAAGGTSGRDGAYVGDVEPCGLYNGCRSDANLCFMNAALQLLMHSVKGFWGDLQRCEGTVAEAVAALGEAAFKAGGRRQACLSQVRLSCARPPTGVGAHRQGMAHGRA